MKIETKHHITKEVWLMHDNKAIQRNIWSCEPIVCISHDRGTITTIRYRLEEHGKCYYESDLFETKETLLQSL